MELGKKMDTQPNKTWGRWTYHPENLTLVIHGRGLHGTGAYDIDLERCTSSAGILDWICQLSHKGWTTPEDLGYLVLALDNLLHPQANACSGGVNKTFDPRKVLEGAR